jgi:Domain of unknown function (DUF4260)
VDVVLAPPIRRTVYAALTTALLATIVAAVVAWGTGYWQLAAFLIGPDLALSFGVGRGLAKGQLHPRAVPLYNALHRLWGPAALVAFTALAGLSRGYLVGAAAWALHIALDRTVGYGLRTRDGFQRN